MADLYINQSGQAVDKNIQPITGNEKIDSYLNTLPPEQRDSALKKITAPMTGEEVAKKLHENPVWKPNKQEFDVFSDYQATKETSLFEGLGMLADGIGAIYDIAGNAVAAMYDHPLESAKKLAPSLLEGGAQNIRTWYGMAAQSQDPSSVLFKWKNVLARDKSPDAYAQFLEARKFNADSVDYETGKRTLLVNKDYIDPDITQAATIIVDPMFYGSMLIPGGQELGVAEKIAQILGMSERLAKAGAFAEKMKSSIYGGTLKYGVGVPLEFIGKTTREAIDASLEKGGSFLEDVTGLSSKDIKITAKIGGFGSIPFGVPYASTFGKAYLGSGAIAGIGEGTKAIGEQIMKNQGKRGLLSFAGQAMRESDEILARGGSGLTPQARKLLTALDKADPMLSYANAYLSGGVHGAVIGGGLGYLGGGEEGAWGGAGAGFGIGSLGGLTGRALLNVNGGLEKQRLGVQMDMLMPMLKDTDPRKHSTFEMIRNANRAAGNPDWVVDRHLVSLDKFAPETRFDAFGAKENEAKLRALGQDPAKFDGYEHTVVKDANGNVTGIEYKLDKNGNKVLLRDAEGYSVPKMSDFDAAGFTMQDGGNGKIKVLINTDKFNDIANTLPHEMLHSVFRELGMKPEFKDRLNEVILGTFDEKGNQIKPPSISKSEAGSFFGKYIENAYSGKDKQQRLSLLKDALDEYYTTGKMTVMDTDGKTPLLSNLSEEFGAYYWTQFINDKPVDYLFKGGELGMVHSLINGVKSSWQDYMERKVGGVNGGFDFAREQHLNPAFRDKSGKRIRVSALDYMMEDLIRTKSSLSTNEKFDFRKLSPEGQEAYVNASGDSITYEPPAKKGDKYTVRTPEQQAKIRAKRGAEMHKGLDAFRISNPEALRIKDANGKDIGGLSLDADGNYTGVVPDAILDYFVKSNHINKVEAERIRLLQKSAKGETPSNVFEFTDYTGETMNVGIGKNIRAKSPNVPTKDRLLLLTSFETKITPNDYGFYAHGLDYKHLELRIDNVWKDPRVRAVWGDDKDALISDLFKYFKNASQPEGVRLPSAQIWSENGEYKRNIMHDISGIQTPSAGTINTANADIAGDMFSTYRKFRTDRMAGLRMSGEKINLTGNEAIDYIRHNMMPSELSDEVTPNGHIYLHPNGYKFLKVEDGVKVVKPDGTEIGKFKTVKEAVEVADSFYQKEYPFGKPISSIDNIRKEPLDAPENVQQYTQRKINEIRSMSDSELQSWIDDLKSSDSEKAYDLDNEVIPSIVKDFEELKTYNENPDLTLQDHIANKFESFIRDKNETFKNYGMKPSSGYNYYDSITHGKTISDFFNYEYNKENGARFLGKNPIFESPLSSALDKILSSDLSKEGTISASRLINRIKNASGGDVGSILTEAKNIGFIDWLKSKGQNRVSKTDIREFIQENGIEVFVDPRINIDADFGETSSYIAKGKIQDYHTFVARINPEHSHGVKGHYGDDVVVHIRATTRTDAEGKKVLLVEEIQSTNSKADELTVSERTKVESEIKTLSKIENIAKEFNKVSKLHYEERGGIIKRAFDVISEGGLESLKEHEMMGNFKTPFNELKDIIFNVGLKNTDEVPMLTDFNFNEIARTPQEETNRLISERNSQLSKKKSDKPLQDFKETVKVASRTIMRKAVELGVDKVAIVPPEEMHSGVTQNSEGVRFVDKLYGEDIPNMINSELKKYGQKLKSKVNSDGKKIGNTERILDKALSYDITPEMKKKAGGTQFFMMPSESESLPFNEFLNKTEKEVGAPWSVPFYKKLEGSILSGSNIDNIRVLNVSVDKNNQVKLKTIKEEQYQSIIKKFPKGKARDNAIRNSIEEINSTERSKGEFRHPLFYLKNDIESIKFDSQSSEQIKQITFNTQTLVSAVDSISNDLSGVEFDKSSTTALFGRRSKTGQVKGIIQNLQDATYELRNAVTQEQKLNASEKVNSYIEELRSLKDELQDKHDNTPESFQETDSYTKREDAIDALDEAITHIEGTTEESDGLNAKSNMLSEQVSAWRDFKAEPTTEGNSVFKNAMNFVIIQANNKFKVYNPQKGLLGIYNDLEEAKKRVRREEPKR